MTGYYRLLSAAVMIAAVCVIGGQTAKAGVIINGGFEQPLGVGWQRACDVIFTPEDPIIAVAPTEGIFHALFSNINSLSDGETPFSGFNASPVSKNETFLGLPAGTLSALGNGTVIEGSVVGQVISVTAGNILSFDYNFLTNEPIQGERANDFAFFTLGSSVFKLADTFAAFVPASGPAFILQTGYRSFSITIPTSGTFMLGFGVLDVDDPLVRSGLLVDNVRVIPEPSTLLLFAVGIIGTAFYGWRRRKRAA
ncbi:PEP-CTERM sorting domain-containing protein [Candidatus Poribacteria bacterium]|nr:PEP-CTERM sorting domain-containing protein [Candidatus Poribacteria bacterium]